MFPEQRKIRVHYNGLREWPALLHTGTHHIVEAALRQPRALGPCSLLVFWRPQSVRTLFLELAESATFRRRMPPTRAAASTSSKSGSPSWRCRNNEPPASARSRRHETTRACPAALPPTSLARSL